MKNCSQPNEAGYFMFELLVVVLLLALMGTNLMSSNIVSDKTRGMAEIRSVALEIAAQTLEEYAAVNPINLDDTDDLSSSALSRDGFSFSRAVDVTVNTDSSRSVVVTVNSDNPLLHQAVVMQAKYPIWGSL